MPVRKREPMEPMSHDFLREMISAAERDGTSVVLTIDEAKVLMDEFEYYYRRKTNPVAR